MSKLRRDLFLVFAAGSLLACLAIDIRAQDKPIGSQRTPRATPTPTPPGAGSVFGGKGRVSDQARNSAAGVIPPDSVRGTIRWKKAYGLVPVAIGNNTPSPVPCGFFFVAALTTQGAPGTFGQLTLLKSESAQLNQPNRVPEEGAYYVCRYLITGLPTNRDMVIMAGMGGSLLLPKLDPYPLYHTTPWIGGTESQPPSGYDRVFMGSRSVRLTENNSRAVVDFEMVYRPISAPPR